MRRHLALCLLATAACGSSDAPPGENVITNPPSTSAAWSAPRLLFENGARLVAGARLHSIGLDAQGRLAHRFSTDEGASWSPPVPIPGAGPVLPLYGPVAAEGATVHVLTRAGAELRMQRSTDGGATWSAPIVLPGYAASGAERVQIDTDGEYVHVFLGRAGAEPDARWGNYYWRSADRGATWSALRVFDDPAGPPSPGGISAEGGVVHMAYAAFRPGVGTLGHRARYMRSTDNGTTWSQPIDVGGNATQPQIRPRPRVTGGRVLVLWEEPSDHDPNGPYPNATRGQIRANRSLDGGVTWQGPRSVSAVSGAYPNHPEIAVGPGAMVHVVYRLSRDQASTLATDSIGYRRSRDYGATWDAQETATARTVESPHPYNVVATAGWVHLVAGGDRFYHARRKLP